jgi:hypothetical protein
MCATQQLPHNASEVVWHAFTNQFLHKDAQRLAWHRPWRDSNTRAFGLPLLWHEN